MALECAATFLLDNFKQARGISWSLDRSTEGSLLFWLH